MKDYFKCSDFKKKLEKYERKLADVEDFIVRLVDLFKTINNINMPNVCKIE